MRQGSDAAILQFSMKTVCAAWNQLIRTNPVKAAHKQVTKNDGPARVQNHRRGKSEPFVFFHAVGIERNNRNLGKICLVQGAPDEADIVAGPAASACLCHDDGKPAGIVPAGKNCVHDLADSCHGGKAGIVVHKPEPGVDRLTVVI